MTGFDDFDAYLALPRVTDLALSPDGGRLVAAVSELDEDGAAFVTALWELDPAGAAPARRLTRSAKGESGPVLHPDGSLLFLSARGGAEDEPAALWQLPPTGEARRLLSRPGGVSRVAVAADAGTLVLRAAVLPGSADPDADTERRAARKDAKVAAVLHRGTPVRYWDHEVGPDQQRLFRLAGPDDSAPAELTPEPGRALDEAGFVVSPDGASAVTGWLVHDEPGLPRSTVVTIDATTGGRSVLADEPDAGFTAPALSRDGAWMVCRREQHTTYDDPPRVSLWLVELATGAGRELVTDPDLWPEAPVFAADGSAVFFTAAQDGRQPVFRVELATGAVTRVSAAGSFTAVQVAPDGRTLYALRSAVDRAPHPVRLSATAVDGSPAGLPCPGAVTAPGRLERVAATAADGTAVSAWLALPESASAAAPAPLLLWIHGGPLSSWNAWSWRWNPWLMVAKGYAVLLPDPALSVGYGAGMIRRGWGQWGGAPYTDLMSVTDAVVARPDVDAERTAAMGGSYGGYLANWVAGHTDRFRCIVSHAGLWALDQFQGTTDLPGYWVREWGLLAERPERYAQWSPHHFAAAIRTPMLVVHGDRDYRVPVGEALRLWWDLQRQGVESTYLSFPDEGHWILKPGNARVWYETVWAWLDQHLRDRPWQQPALL